MTDGAGFDPYAVLRELERKQVAYVLIGGLARVLHGSDEVTQGVDLTPALRASNLERLRSALEDLGTAGQRGQLPEGEGLVEARVNRLNSRHGVVQIVAEPVGTSGYQDLRRRAARQPIGEGLRPSVAAPGDLARMLEALGRPDDLPTVLAMQRIVELERGRGLER